MIREGAQPAPCVAGEQGVKSQGVRQSLRGGSLQGPGHGDLPLFVYLPLDTPCISERGRHSSAARADLRTRPISQTLRKRERVGGGTVGRQEQHRQSCGLTKTSCKLAFLPAG